MTTRRVLSIGQCAADHDSIRRMFEEHLQAEVIPADTAREAVDQLRAGGFSLVLVNRLLDADGSPGFQIIKQLKQDEQLGQIPVMLVTNYEQHQREAVAAGAVPGFGKAELGTPETLERLREYLSENDE